MDPDERYLEELRAEFPKLRVVEKAGDGLSKAIDLLLKVLTFGGQRHFLTRYVTVLGSTIYVPSNWAGRSPIDRLIVLRHEAVHLRQGRRYGFLGMSFLYLIPFFPIGLAYGRARIEWEAYAETLRATAELRGLERARGEQLREHIVTQFTSSAYGWMWPFPDTVRGWIQEELDRIESELVETTTP